VAVLKPIILFELLAIGAMVAHGQPKSSKTSFKDTVPMKVDSLKVVVVTATMRPRLKGDTVEYNTEHVKMQSNSVVEDLLRRLPGLEIAVDGTITYNGERIQHVFVDGEDIFGSNPTMIMQNFDASKIARVQILDRKNDQATFTGVDDGKRIKTLNLVLKETAKDGYFGKAMIGGDIKRYYSTDGLLAGFRDREQYNVLVSSSNTGHSSFGLINGNSDPLGASAGVGIPRISAVGLHYANVWNGSRDHLAANYEYRNFFSKPMTVAQTIEIQPDSIYSQFQKSQSANQVIQQLVSAEFDWAPSRTSAFKFLIRGSNLSAVNQYNATGEGTFNNVLVNNSQRAIRDRVEGQFFGEAIFWRVQLGKSSDRIISVASVLNKDNSATNGYLNSVNEFYQPNGVIQSVDTTDERKVVSSDALVTDNSISFTEPLWKNAILGINYGIGLTTDQPAQKTFGHSDGKYENLIDSLSSEQKTEILNQHALFNVKGQVGGLSYTIGTSWLGFEFHQHDLIHDSMLHHYYSGWSPSLLVVYSGRKDVNLRFNYEGVTQEPSISQLTAIKNNNDPLNVSIGNPALKPVFNQSLNLDIRQARSWTINLNLNCSFSGGSISSKTTTDSLGRQAIEPVNVNGNKAIGFGFWANKKIFGVEVGFNVNGRYLRTFNYINTMLSRNENYIGSLGFSLMKHVLDKYSLEFNTNLNYLDQTSTVNLSAPLRYWTQSESGLITIYLLKSFEFNTSATYTWQEKTSAFVPNSAVLLWNGYIARNFFRGNFVVRLEINNILNANAGVSRTSTANINTQAWSNILGRYWMLSAIFHFDRKFKRK